MVISLEEEKLLTGREGGQAGSQALANFEGFLVSYSQQRKWLKIETKRYFCFYSTLYWKF